MNRLFHEYAPYKGEIQGRRNGVLISNDAGEAVAYAMWKLEDRRVADILGRLKSLDVIAPGPRAPMPGAPIAWVTTARFLEIFTLGSLRDLPDLDALDAAGAGETEIDDEIEGALDDALGLFDTQGAPDDDTLTETEWEAYERPR
jgi:hypothetical protein